MEINNIYSFLIELQFNNNRKWFLENKNNYNIAKNEFEKLVTKLIEGIGKFDKSVNNIKAKDCIFRIYRDVRFSKNKTPYKNNFGAFISKSGKKNEHAGYYIHIEPDNSFIGGGIYKPHSHLLKSTRTKIYNNINTYKKIIYNNNFKTSYGEIYGDRLKNAPKGFPKDFEDIELLKPKNFTVIKQIDNNLLLKKDLIPTILNLYKTLYPFNIFLNN